MKLPLWVKAVALGGLGLLLWAAVARHNETMREEGRAEIRGQVAKQSGAQAEQNAKETQRRLARQKENDDAAAANLAALAADRAHLRDAADGMREHIADLEHLARSVASCDPAAEGQRAAAGAAAGMLAELQRRADERTGILADYADRARIAGLQCQADYGDSDLVHQLPMCCVAESARLGAVDESADVVGAGWVRQVRQADQAGQVPGRDGRGAALGRSVRVDRAALSEGRPRPPAGGAGAHAAHSLPAALVQPQ